jgi:hypothetical protein
MLNSQSVDKKIISLAEAVRAEVLFEVDMHVSFPDFYLLSLQKKKQDELFLNYNLYKYQV